MVAEGSKDARLPLSGVVVLDLTLARARYRTARGLAERANRD